MRRWSDVKNDISRGNAKQGSGNGNSVTPTSTARPAATAKHGTVQAFTAGKPETHPGGNFDLNILYNQV
jgi:hypothetical protein